MQKVNTVIMDFDNTLFDWFTYWHASFSALLTGLEAKSALSREVLIPEIRQVHQLHRTSEYHGLLQAMAPLLEKKPGVDVSIVYQDVLELARLGGEAFLTLYPTVHSTLAKLKAKGVLLVIYTESQARYAHARLKKFELDGMIDFIYTPENPQEQANQQPDEVYSPDLQKTKHQLLPPEDIKPNRKVLLDIMDAIGSRAENTLYVGDSLMKDIYMANQAGVTSAFAAYGAKKDTRYELLQQVSHWTNEDIAHEKQLMEAMHGQGSKLEPTFTLHQNLGELLHLVEFFKF